MDVQRLIDNWVRGIAGEPCWGVVAGSGGSMFSLDIGQKLPRRSPVPNPTLSDDVRNNEAEYSLFVQCALWKLGHDRPEGVTMITDANDDASINGPLVCGLETLIGKTIDHATFDPVTADLDVYFTHDHVRLKVFGESDGCSGYSLFLPNDIVTIDGPNRLSHEPRGT